MDSRQARSSKSQPLSNVWTAHLKDPDEIDLFVKTANAVGHSEVLKRLLSIVQRDREQAAINILSTRNYESPSWGYIQADSTGYQRALMTVEALLKGILKT